MAAPPQVTPADVLLGLTPKELKALLHQRGMLCHAAVEKAELVQALVRACAAWGVLVGVGHARAAWGVRDCVERARARHVGLEHMRICCTGRARAMKGERVCLPACPLPSSSACLCSTRMACTFIILFRRPSRVSSVQGCAFLLVQGVQ